MKKTVKRLLLLGIITVILMLGRHTSVFSAYLNQESTFNNIVIFIRFADESDYTAPYDLNHYEDLFNGLDTVSLKDYYDEVSYGSLAINSFVVSDNTNIIYYDDIYNRSYFEPYDASTNPNGYTAEEETAREHNLLKRALDYVETNNLIPDDLVLDYNGDGQIDSLTFLFSGEDSGWMTIFWPHKWQLHTFVDGSSFTTDAPTINGINAYVYTVGLLGNSIDYNYQADVATLAHETFHLLSAPDLYHYYGYQNIDPVGTWGLMEDTGVIPSHMLGYMKYQYGSWMNDAPEITTSGTYTLNPLNDGPNNYLKIDTGTYNEWIYLEYRYQSGLYESNLDDSGLIAYRVDYDFINEGNMYGYYNDDGEAVNEVFVFRPGIVDTTDPYTFLDNTDDANDGDYTLAAVSQNNAYSTMGYNTDIPIFLNNGDELYIRIDNVMEANGSITFDVYLPPEITLDTYGDTAYQGSDLVLYDHPNTSYHVTIDHYDPIYDTFYTLDGTEPNTNSTQYTGGDIAIDATHHTVKTVTYDGTTIIAKDEQTFSFESTIESAHNPYHDDVNKTWYINTAESNLITLTLNPLTEIEDNYDYLDFYNNIEAYEFTGVIGNDTNTYEFSEPYVFVTFTSDALYSDYYGFSINVDITSAIGLGINGEQVIDHSVNTLYDDLGVTILGTDDPSYYVEVTNLVDDTTLGTYTITYVLKDGSNTVIDTIERTVNVVDTESPVITLTGDTTLHIEYDGIYTEEDATCSDNYDESCTVSIGGDTVDTGILGTYTVTYNTTDMTGNIANEVTRTVIVEDTTAPIITLNGASEITLDVGSQYTEPGATVNDNYDESLDIVIGGDTVDVTTVGTYSVTYNATDSSGNKAVELERTVIIEDISPPIITLNNAVDTLFVGDEYTDPSVTITDDTSTTLLTEGSVDMSQAGTYILTYTVTDENDNVTIIKRAVTVLDKPHDITFELEDALTTLNVGDTFNDTGCQVIIDEEIENCDVIDNNVDVTSEGIYTVTYGVTIDNVSYTYERYVFVLEEGALLDTVAYIERKKVFTDET